MDLPPDLRHLVRPRLRVDRRRRAVDARARAGRSPSCRSRPARRPRRLSRLAAAGLSRRGPGQLVPRAGHRAGQRGGHRRQERARRPPGRPHAAEAMDAPDHRLRRAPGRRPGGRRLARADQGHAAQLDRPQRRGRGRFPDRPATADPRPIRVFTTRPDTLFGATYMVLAPEHPLVDRITTEASARRRRRLSPGRRAQERPRPHRPGQDQDRRLHRRYAINPVNGERDPDLDRRLRADGLRHRRDHGRPRPRRARLRVRPAVRPADRPRRRRRARIRPTRRSTQAEAEPGVAVNSRNDVDRPRRPADRRGQGRDHRLARGTRPGQEDGQLQAPRLALQPPALLGRAVPDRARRARSRPGRPRVGAARPAPRAGRLPAHRQARAAARQGDRMGPLLGQGSAARPTRCPSGPARAGTTSATSTRRTTSSPGTPRREGTGCRSTSTSAAPSTRSCTCSTAGSGTRCSSTAGTSARPSRSRGW